MTLSYLLPGPLGEEIGDDISYTDLFKSVFS